MFNSSRRHGGESAEYAQSTEGWVIAEITPYPRPLRLLSQSNAGHYPNSFMPAKESLKQLLKGSLAGSLTGSMTETLEDFFAVHYAPPEAQFVLAVVQYPGVPVQRSRLRWGDIEIVLRSPDGWPVQMEAGERMDSPAPQETPALRRLVEALAAEAVRHGWEAAGSGRTWCSLRFRQRR